MSTNRHLQWEELKCCGEMPVGRVGESLTTSEDQSQVFLYGGMVEPHNRPVQYLDEFYAFNPDSSRWERRSLVPVNGDVAAQSHPRAFHSTVTYGGRLYVFGGCTEADHHNDLVCVDPANGTREVVVRDGESSSVTNDTPAPRYCHSAVVFEDAMYIFGGKSGNRSSNDRLADIFKFDFETKKWTHVEQRGDVPPPRSAHSAVVCGRRMFVFGGRQPDGACSGDMYEYAFDTHVWRRLGDNNCLERARHSAVLHNGVIAVFGGWNGRKKLNDLYLHALDGSHHEVETEDANVPARRDCHAAVMWRNTMLVFSGRYRVNALDDVQALRLGPMSLVEQCRDWLAQHRVQIDHNVLPDRLAHRIKAWETIQSRDSETAPLAADRCVC
jgi:N-acetylneuraminic acid mutarotase